MTEPTPPRHDERHTPPNTGETGIGNGDGDRDGAPSPDAEAARVGPFRPGTLRWQLGRDAAARWAVSVAVLAAVLWLMLADMSDHPAMMLLVVLAVAAAWLGISAVNSRATRALPQIGQAIDAHPADAEAMLAAELRRWPLLRWVRLLLYHHLAMLRHRQHRYAESAHITRHVLGYPLGPAGAQRGNMLLMLTEACLQLGDLVGAYHALNDLHATPLSLFESMQRLVLQTRYEVVVGHDQAALARVHEKLQLAELMSAPQCGAMHAMLARSAERAEQHDLARWLWARAALLCTPDQLDQLRRGGFAPDA